jgi:hypothetical protein
MAPFHTELGGKDFITLEIDRLFYFPNQGKITEGSKIIIRITYELPIPFHYSKEDSALFEAGKDASGNPIWIKKPMGGYANYRPLTEILHAGTNMNF